MMNRIKDNSSADPNVLYSGSYLIDTDLGYNNNLSSGFMNDFKINTSVNGSQSAPTSLTTSREHFHYPHYTPNMDYMQCIPSTEDSFGSSCSSGAKLSYPLSQEQLQTSNYIQSSEQSIDSYFSISENVIKMNEVDENDNSEKEDPRKIKSRGRGGQNSARKRHVNQENNDDGRNSCGNSTFGANSSQGKGKHGKALARHPFIPSYMDPNNGPHLCVVCKHNASGFHYRVMACEGCKGFFRRTVQNNLFYSCKFNKKCEIQPHNRAQCQECRWRKCLEVGMAKDLVLSEEARRAKKDLIAANRAKKLTCHKSTNKDSIEVIDATSPDSKEKQSLKICEEDEEIIGQIKRAFSETDAMDTEVTQNFQDPGIVQILQHMVDHHVTSLIIKCDIVDDCYINSAKFNFPDQFNVLSIIVKPMLQRIISFAFMLPRFTELSVGDQIILLRNACFDLVCLRNAINYNKNNQVLQLGADFLVTNDLLKSHKLLEPSYVFVRRISSLNIDHVEISLMAALALICCDRLGLQDVGKVESVQDDILHLIDYYMKQNSHENTHRQSELYATILPELRSTTSWFTQIMINSVDSVTNHLLPTIKALYRYPEMRACPPFSESSKCSVLIPSSRGAASAQTRSMMSQAPLYEPNLKYLSYPYIGHTMPPLYRGLDTFQSATVVNVYSNVHLASHSGQSSFTELLVDSLSADLDEHSMLDKYTTQESSLAAHANHTPVTSLCESTHDNSDPVFDFSSDLI